MLFVVVDDDNLLNSLSLPPPQSSTTHGPCCRRGVSSVHHLGVLFSPEILVGSCSHRNQKTHLIGPLPIDQSSLDQFRHIALKNKKVIFWVFLEANRYLHTTRLPPFEVWRREVCVLFMAASSSLQSKQILRQLQYFLDFRKRLLDDGSYESLDAVVVEKLHEKGASTVFVEAGKPVRIRWTFAREVLNLLTDVGKALQLEEQNERGATIHQNAPPPQSSAFVECFLSFFFWFLLFFFRVLREEPRKDNNLF